MNLSLLINLIEELSKPLSSDWESVENWYDGIVGKQGHYYHRHVILPRLIPLINLNEKSRLLDLACGQGVLARSLPKISTYHGIDLSPSLIKKAKEQKRVNHSFSIGDICKPLTIKEKNFSHATIVLALQNVEKPQLALKNAAAHLIEGGSLALILNHPCFRIPRQTHWGIDQEKKLQYRRIDHYLSPLKIPIQAHPGKKNSETTWSFHHSLTDYSRFLAEAGFLIELIEEWTSDKKSTGKAARMENRARREFPLFLTILAKKSPK